MDRVWTIADNPSGYLNVIVVYAEDLSRTLRNKEDKINIKLAIEVLIEDLLDHKRSAEEVDDKIEQILVDDIARSFGVTDKDSSYDSIQKHLKSQLHEIIQKVYDDKHNYDVKFHKAAGSFCVYLYECLAHVLVKRSKGETIERLIKSEAENNSLYVPDGSRLMKVHLIRTFNEWIKVFSDVRTILTQLSPQDKAIMCINLGDLVTHGIKYPEEWLKRLD
jgi:hypothetical protein